MHMRVDGNRGLFESVDQYAVGCFPAYRRKLEQLLDIVWHLPFVFFENYVGDSLDGPGLGSVEAYGFDESSNGLWICFGKLRWSGILGEES